MVAVGSATAPLWLRTVDFHIPDLRLALIITACSYITTLLLDEKFPRILLEGLRTVRQNLAFNRISTDLALAQTDLLLAGAGLAQVLTGPFNAFSNALQEARAQGEQIAPQISELKTLTTELSGVVPCDESHQPRAAKLLRAYDSLVPRVQCLRKAIVGATGKFNYLKMQHQLLITMDPAAPDDSSPEITKVSNALASIQAELQETDAVMGAAKKVAQHFCGTSFPAVSRSTADQPR